MASCGRVNVGHLSKDPRYRMTIQAGRSLEFAPGRRDAEALRANV